jgi:membrane-bound lytic murein transglycosylase C
LFVSAQEDFEDFKRKQKQGVAAQQQDFENFSQEVTRQYEDWLKEHQRQYEEYLKSIGVSWGKKNVKQSTPSNYVAYDQNFQGRRSVDFKEGKVTIEVLVPEKDANNIDEIRKRLAQGMVALVSDKGTSDPMLKKEEKKPLPEPVVEGQLVTKGGEKVTPQNAKQYAEETVKQQPVEKKPVVGADGQKRVAVSVQVPLVPNHLRERAGKYKEMIQQFAKRFGLEPAFAFAIVHCESYFNPLARSSVAYGMMQLVPGSGGRTAYKHLYGQDRLLGPDYLLDAKNNVELGTGLLNFLMSKQYKDVTNPVSRMYCAIGAYNSGPVNVAASFGFDKKTVPKAIPVINSLSPEEVWERLNKKNPLEEGRNYIKNVSQRIPLYKEWNQF